MSQQYIYVYGSGCTPQRYLYGSGCTPQQYSAWAVGAPPESAHPQWAQSTIYMDRVVRHNDACIGLRAAAVTLISVIVRDIRIGLHAAAVTIWYQLSVNAECEYWLVRVESRVTERLARGAIDIYMHMSDVFAWEACLWTYWFHSSLKWISIEYVDLSTVFTHLYIEPLSESWTNVLKQLLFKLGFMRCSEINHWFDIGYFHWDFQVMKCLWLLFCPRGCFTNYALPEGPIMTLISIIILNGIEPLPKLLESISKWFLLKAGF